MSGGPIVALCLAKTDAIKDWRSLMGPTNTQTARESSPHSLRARFGTDGTQNATHGSDSPASAARELKFFFPNAILDPVPEGAAAREYIQAELTPVLVKGFAALCKEKPSAQRLEAIQWLADWLRENNPRKANAFAEEDLALDPADEDAGDFETARADVAPVDAADVSEALDDLEEQMKAAVTVQSHFRGHQARRNASRDRAAAAGGSAVTVVLESHADADEEHAAAAKLQATYRGHASRRETKKMQEEEAQAATRLQSGFRGFQARREVEERRAERAELASAATKVQAGFRGHQDRKKIADMKRAGAGATSAPEQGDGLVGTAESA
jgi:nucleoside-diphosphate kinase